MNAKRWMTGPVRLVVASVAMIVAGCGGGGSSSSPIGASAPAIDPYSSARTQPPRPDLRH